MKINVVRIRTTILIFSALLFIAMPLKAACDSLQSPELSAARLQPISDIVAQAIRDGKTPGAVILIGSNGRVIYSKASGYREIEPEKLPMAEDTIFDVASLTKVVATTTAVMQLIEKGKLRLDAPVVKYWPAFRSKGKAGITIRQLLTHYSGLKPDLSMKSNWAGYMAAMQKIISEKPLFPPGSVYMYSDINFEVLGELVQRITGQSLDKYCAENIFKPLGMKDTGFNPPLSLRPRIAPTEFRNGRLICGEVHDPSCFRMGGVAGHAGLFSTAIDLSKFAQMLLNGGTLDNVRILKPETVALMTSPQSPKGGKLRGLGWDIGPSLTAPDEFRESGSYGHLGYTGTAIWIDPRAKTYVIVLTNRVHPNGGGDVGPLRAQIKAAVSEAFTPVLLTRPRPFLPANMPILDDNSKVRTGIDVLCEENFSALAGLRIGLITNHTGIDSTGRRTLDLLFNAPGVKLKAIFSPEHGIDGTLDSKVGSTRDKLTGLPIYSLYGETKRPTDKMLQGLDALVFDIQDAGVRFYTYITTRGYAMEAAAEKGIAFYVLDRPNPITASFVQGPVADNGMKSFTSYFPLPVRHGMTVGELAEMFNSEYKIGVKLNVIRMQGYHREEWLDQTGLSWTNPSPNLRSLPEATLYPGVAIAEGANVSVGRGTATPFELLGAPWIDAGQLSSYLNKRNIPGIIFMPVDFTPDANVYKNRLCHGVRITLTDRIHLDPAYMGVEIVSALRTLYPKEFRIDDTLGLLGQRWVLDAIKDGQDPKTIALKWEGPLSHFLDMRSKYLLY